MNSLRVIAPELQYPIQFVELSVEGNSPVHFEIGDFHISALPLAHALTCVGYSIEIPRAGKFDPRRAKEKNIPLQYWSLLQNGGAAAGYSPEMVLGLPRKGIKVSYITDTRPIGTIPEFIEGSDLLICEGMYGDDAMKQKADRFHHMVFSDAARLAEAGKVRELWLTHYSQAFSDPENYISEARKIFENTFVGTDRMTKSFAFED